MVSSCGGHNEESILKKIKNNEQLTESEYKFIEDYVKEADKKMKEVQEKIANGAFDENDEKTIDYLAKVIAFKEVLFEKESGDHSKGFEFENPTEEVEAVVVDYAIEDSTEVGEEAIAAEPMDY